MSLTYECSEISAMPYDVRSDVGKEGMTTSRMINRMKPRLFPHVNQV